jgi:hypothetical protein
MNNQLGGHENWKCHQKSNMHLNVLKKGKPIHVSTQGPEGRKEQQRQPGDNGDNEQPPIHEFQGVSDEMRFPKELENRTT